MKTLSTDSALNVCVEHKSNTCIRFSGCHMRNYLT